MSQVCDGARGCSVSVARQTIKSGRFRMVLVLIGPENCKLYAGVFQLRIPPVQSCHCGELAVGSLIDFLCIKFHSYAARKLSLKFNEAWTVSRGHLHLRLAETWRACSLLKLPTKQKVTLIQINRSCMQPDRTLAALVLCTVCDSMQAWVRRAR